uniref:Uncharacterized protein n=1 Tax=Chromera velia CCMP2878 TaxID=1169474 RepID=A0A0G4F008_9ALVE|eukprot:Cvel_2554.t1-p1 / transcript=Cvel_2554.t1 / gene=Cvel_2554 / organism=Chromera_velia_CCMP2878 / gene_product=hypothetical protein / transcript_product=hypothetical protein / location=Cvel_scaffold101:17376-19914(+) / protein_length=136 / sequence_SO=supercontig / SO=protein_coding / is_pseudo=false
MQLNGEKVPVQPRDPNLEPAHKMEYVLMTNDEHSRFIVLTVLGVGILVLLVVLIAVVGILMLWRRRAEVHPHFHAPGGPGGPGGAAPGIGALGLGALQNGQGPNAGGALVPVIPSPPPPGLLLLLLLLLLEVPRQS